MIDELRRDARILQVLPDQTRVFVVGFLWRSSGRLLRLQGRAEGESDERRDGEDAGFHPAMVIRIYLGCDLCITAGHSVTRVNAGANGHGLIDTRSTHSIGFAVRSRFRSGLRPAPCPGPGNANATPYATGSATALRA